jgi:hypothetical protein
MSDYLMATWPLSDVAIEESGRAGPRGWPYNTCGLGTGTMNFPPWAM